MTFPSVPKGPSTSVRGAPPGRHNSWRWFILPVILLAAVTFGGVFMSVVQAQDAGGAITGLTLSSDAPGELVVSWDMPSPTPTDYRVDWAKSGEDYRSWKVDEGHVYPAGTATTVTVTGLEPGVEYKLRMRARYHKGEHKSSPWSGPWSDDAVVSVAAGPETEPTPEPLPPTIIEVDDDEDLIALQQNSDGPLVSNRGQSDDGEAEASGGTAMAQSFTAGPGLAGFEYRFEGIQVDSRRSPPLVKPAAEVSVHRDAGGQPGSRLFGLSVPSNFAVSNTFNRYTLSAPEGSVLRPGARYWVVFEVSARTLKLRTTNTGAEDANAADGWPMGNTCLSPSGSIWLRVQSVTRKVLAAVLMV